jgi:predicted extracellular nuclease
LRVTLDDGRKAQNPDPARHPDGADFTLTNRFRGGDHLTGLTGVVDYSYGAYAIQPTAGATYTSVNPRTATPDPVGGTMTVASFNVLNYFTTLGSRGADDPEEFERQRTKIFAALADIDADVFGLIEIENNTEAIVNLVDGLNGVVGAGTYDYIDTGAIGGDQIKVAFIYKTATVAPDGAYAVLDDPSFLDPNNLGSDKNRPALAQTFVEIATGEKVTVAVNHLKSKGSECGPGDDDAEQGHCNLTRTLAAGVLVDWLAGDPTGSGDPDALIIGDLNSYDREDPIDAVRAGPDDTPGTADDYADLVAAYGGEYAYSYVYSGQWGYLDYALANGTLGGQVTGTTVWHINADEPDILDYDTTYKKPAQDALYEPNAYRSSDHDPVVVGLRLDTVAPELAVTATPDMLWPPNHRYRDVTVDVVATDNSGSVTVELVSVTSSEADCCIRRHDRPDDIVIVDDTTFQLRAERYSHAGRTYTLTYRAVDAAGNETTATAEVTVPHSRRHLHRWCRVWYRRGHWAS